jgi:tetratricopeptide (TPR) repeat protein
MATKLNNVKLIMLTDIEVLAALSEVLSPGELSKALEKILHVPEVWHKLHDPDFLGKVQGLDPALIVVPGHLASMALDASDAFSPDFPLCEVHEAQLTHLWKNAINGHVEVHDLETIALLAVGLIRSSSSDNGSSNIAQLVVQAPELWRSPLVCAWPSLNLQEEFLSILINKGQSIGISLAVYILLANMSPSETANALINSVPSASNKILLYLQSQGIYPLAEIFAEAVISRIPDDELTPDNLEELLALGIRYVVRGDVETSRDYLNRAWDVASHTTGLVADQVAEIASLEGDPVVEIEARQQALHSHPIPMRRALVGLALLNMDRADEALSIVQHSSKCVEEQIVFGLALAKMGERSQATEVLCESVQQLSVGDSYHDTILKTLLENLKEIGERQLALTVARQQVRRKPSSIEARIDLSQLLELAGDPHAAAEQANLALALNPDSHSARYSLAHSLQVSGHPDIALPHWQTLADTGQNVLVNLAACALDANHIDLARETAHKLLQEDAQSIDGQLVLGKAFKSEGNLESAKIHLEKIVQESPQNPNTWIALADCQEYSGDTNSAGDTLSTGIQAIPNNGNLHIAYSRWLRRQGRLSDALEYAKKATELDSDQAQWLIEYSDLLFELGHHDQALPILEIAISHQPENLKARQALALAYEQCGEVVAAAHLIQKLPPAITPKMHFLVGRILAKSITQGENHPLNDAVDHLEQARSGGIENISIDYWLGMAYEHSGQAAQAFKAYQSCLRNTAEKDQELHQDAVQGLARSALVTNKVSLALSTLEEERKRNPGSIDLLVLLTQAYLAAELPDQAVRIAQHAVDQNPSSEKALNILCRAAIHSGDQMKAIQAVERIVDIHPEDVNAWLEIAGLYQEVGEQKSSRHALAKALLIGRYQPHALERAAGLLEKTGDCISAHLLLQRASRLQPDDLRINQQLASISEGLGDLQTAFTAWQRCVELEPDNHNLLSHVAKTAWDLDHRELAIDCWQRAALARPDDVTIQLQLARAYLEIGEINHSYNHYASALEIKPDDAELSFEAGMVILRFGDPDGALSILQQAVRLAPESVDAHIGLGECLLKLGQSSEARDVLEKLTHDAGPPQRAFSMLALASLDTNDLSSAEAAYDTARGTPLQTQEDAIWFSKVASRMGYWQPAMEVLENWLLTEQNGAIAFGLARIRLRLKDAYWLYAEACDAHNHAPDSALTTSEAHQKILELIEVCHQAGTSNKSLDELKLWASISFDKYNADDPQSLDSIFLENTSAEITQALAIAYMRNDRPEYSEEILSSYSGSSDPDSWSAIIYGLIHSAKKDYSKAHHAYQAAAQNPVIKPMSSFLNALTWSSEGNVTEAISSFNTALAAWSNEPLWHFKLASVYQDDGRYDAAVPHFQQAVEITPDNFDFLLALARALRYSDQLTEAETVYARALKSVPKSGHIWKEAGLLALANCHIKRAEAWIARACRLLPSDAHCLIGSARAAMALGHTNQAIDRAQTAIRLAPDDFDVLFGMGEILALQGKYEDALKIYDQALDRTNDPLIVQLARSKLLIRIGRPSQAEASLRSILESEPDDHRAWFALAEIQEATEHIESALDTASHAVRISPRNSTYRLLVGRLCRKCGQLDRALDELAQAQSFSPSDVRIAVEIGHIYEARREVEQALEAYNQAISLDPSNDEAYFRAGLILKQLKSYQQAALMIERAIELNPKDPDALHQLAAVRALELVHGGSLNPAVSS